MSHGSKTAKILAFTVAYTLELFEFFNMKFVQFKIENDDVHAHIDSVVHCSNPVINL